MGVHLNATECTMVVDEGWVAEALTGTRGTADIPGSHTCIEPADILARPQQNSCRSNWHHKAGHQNHMLLARHHHAASSLL